MPLGQYCPRESFWARQNTKLPFTSGFVFLFVKRIFYFYDIAMIHKITIKEKYFKLIKSGQKTVELRLYTLPFQQIKIGDRLEFINKDKSMITNVTGLVLSDTFKNLFTIIKPTDAGFSSVKEALDIMETFYPIHRQLDKGVVGIKIKL